MLACCNICFREAVPSSGSLSDLKKPQSASATQSSTAQNAGASQTRKAHRHVQTDPGKGTALRAAAKSSSLPTRSVQTQPQILSAASVQTETVVGVSVQMQTDSMVVASSSSQTLSHALRSKEVQTTQGSLSSVKEVCTQICASLVECKAVQTANVEIQGSDPEKPHISRATEEKCVQCFATLMDSKSVQTDLSEDKLTKDDQDPISTSKAGQEMSTQCYSAVTDSRCTQTGSENELRQGVSAEHMSDTATTVLAVTASHPASSVPGSYFRSHSHEVSNVATTKESNSRGRKRRHSLSSVPAPGCSKRVRSVPIQRQTSHVRSADDDIPFNSSTQKLNSIDITLGDLSTLSGIESEASFHTAHSAAPDDSLMADLALSDDNEEQENLGVSVTDDVSDMEPYGAGHDLGDSENKNFEDQHDWVISESVSQPSAIESPSEDNRPKESSVFKHPTHTASSHTNCSKKPTCHAPPSEPFTDRHREPSLPVLGPFKHVQGDEWKRKLLLWATYGHRRASRRQEINAVYCGSKPPKLFDWRSVGWSSASDTQSGKELKTGHAQVYSEQLQPHGQNKTAVNHDRTKEKGQEYAYTRQNTLGSSTLQHDYVLKDDPRQQVAICLDAEALQQDPDDGDVEVCDPDRHSDHDVVSAGNDSLFSDAKSIDSGHAVHLKKVKKKKRKKDKASAEERSDKREKKKRKTEKGKNKGRKNVAIRADLQMSESPTQATETFQELSKQPLAASHDSDGENRTMKANSDHYVPSPRTDAAAAPDCQQVQHSVPIATMDISDIDPSEKCSMMVVQDAVTSSVVTDDVPHSAQDRVMDTTWVCNEKIDSTVDDADASSRASIADDALDHEGEGRYQLEDARGADAIADSKLETYVESSTELGNDADDDSDFSIHTDDSDTGDSTPKKLTPKNTCLQNISVLQPAVKSASESSVATASDGEFSDSETNEAVNKETGKRQFPEKQGSLLASADTWSSGSENGEGNECRVEETAHKLSQPVSLSVAEVAGQRQVHESTEVVDTSPSKDVTVPYLCSNDNLSKHVAIAEISAADQRHSSVEEVVSLHQADQSAVAFHGFHLPTTPQKQTAAKNTGVVEVRTPDGKLVNRLFASGVSPVWSPEKTSMSVFCHESMDTTLYDKLLGVPSSNSGFLEDARNSNFASSEEVSARDVITTRQPVIHMAEKASSSTWTAAMAKQSRVPSDEIAVMKEPKRALQSEREGGQSEIGSDEMCCDKQQTVTSGKPCGVDDNTPLFGYPTFTTVLKGGSKISFHYNRRPDYLAPSSSSSASSVTASSSSSSTTTGSSSSSEQAHLHQVPASTAQSRHRLEVIPEGCSRDGAESQGFSVQHATSRGAAASDSPDGGHECLQKKELFSESGRTKSTECCKTDRRSELQKPASLGCAESETLSGKIEERVKNKSVSYFAQEPRSENSSCTVQKQGVSSIQQSAEDCRSLNEGQVAYPSATSRTMAQIQRVELEEGEIHSSDSFSQRSGETSHPVKEIVPSVSELMEESLEEGEIRAGDDSLMDAADVTNTVQVKSLRAVNNENAQFRDLREVLKPRRHPEVSHGAESNAKDRKKVGDSSKDRKTVSRGPKSSVQECRSQNKAEECKPVDKTVDERNVNKVVTKDITKHITELDQNVQVRREKNRKQVEKVRRQIFSGQVDGDDSPEEDNPSVSELCSYKIPKLGKKSTISRSRSAIAGDGEDRCRGDSKGPRRSTRISSHQARPFSSHPLRTSPSTHNTGSVPSTSSNCTRSLHHGEAQSSRAEIDNLAASKALTQTTVSAMKTCKEKGVAGELGSQLAEDKEDESDLDVVESSDEEISLDSDSGSSGSLTDPDLEGCCRTRRFIYYRNPYKDRPELEMDIEDDDEEQEPDEDAGQDGQNGQDGSTGEEHEGDNDGMEGEEFNKYQDMDDESSGEQDAQEQTDAESDKECVTQGCNECDELSLAKALDSQSKSEQDTHVHTVKLQRSDCDKTEEHCRETEGGSVIFFQRHPCQPKKSKEKVPERSKSSEGGDVALGSSLTKICPESSTTDAGSLMVKQKGKHFIEGQTSFPSGHTGVDRDDKGHPKVLTVRKDDSQRRESGNFEDEERSSSGEVDSCDSDSEDEIIPCAEDRVSDNCHLDEKNCSFKSSPLRQIDGDVSQSDGEILESNNDEVRKNHESPELSMESSNVATNTTVSRDIVADCLSLDAFGSDSNFLLEFSDPCAFKNSKVESLKPSEKSDNSKQSDKDGKKLEPASVSSYSASLLKTSKTRTSTALNEKETEKRRTKFPNKNCSSTCADLKTRKVKPQHEREQELSTSRSWGLGKHRLDRGRHRRQSACKNPSSVPRRKCHSPCSFKENHRSTRRRCSFERHASSSERCVSSHGHTHLRRRSLELGISSGRGNDRFERRRDGWGENREKTCRCCQHRPVFSRHRSPSPRCGSYTRHFTRRPCQKHSPRSGSRSRDRKASYMSDRHRHHHEHHGSRSCSSDEGERLSVRSHSDFRSHMQFSHGNVKERTWSRSPRREEDCACSSCLPPNPRSCQSQVCHDGKKTL